MSEEIFRFRVLRPPQRYSTAQTRTPLIAAYPEQRSPFAESLVDLSATEMAGQARKFIGGATYAASLKRVDSRLGDFDIALLPPADLGRIDLPAAILFWFQVSATALVSEPKFKSARQQLADSLLAASLVDGAAAPGQESLVRGLQLCGLIESIGRGGSAAEGRAMLRALVVLPRIRAKAVKKPATPSPVLAKQQDRARKLQQMSALRESSAELKRVLRRKRMKYAALGPMAKDEVAKLPVQDRLASSEIAALTSETRALFTLFELPRDNVYLPAVIEHFDAYINVELGAQFTLPWILNFGVPSVPTSVGRARIAGINDLLLVRQQIRRYEPGEIAHIENVLRGESYTRVFRRKDMSEVLDEEESERTESLERDLQTTSKFELKTEAERTIQEDLRFEAGVTVTASGPGIEVGANVGFEYSRSLEEATKAATTFARDVVDRSVSKLQERELKRRSTRTTREIEETADHKISNAEGTEHVVGVYRWVDKIYEAQLVNYGRRLILEFVLIEPAAFYRSARGNRSLPGVVADLPTSPQFLDATTGEPRSLEVKDIDEGNYLNWVAQYAVTGVNTPPSQYVFAATALEQGTKTPPADSAGAVLTAGALKVEPGYVANEIRLDWAGDRDAAGAYWEIIVGTHEFSYSSDSASPVLDLPITDGFKYDGEIPVSIVVKNFGSFTANIVVRCERTEAKLEAWKLATFTSIMTRYGRLKADYEDKLAAAEVQQGVAMGANPANNREIERNELRRQSIAMITGQNFDLFNAMGDSGSPLRLPQVNDFSEAKAEGNYLQFFEQSLEWRYMSYVFYPYFWGHKAGWAEVLNQQEDDPLFAQFLRAGAARVQVPVRPGFEEAVGFFLNTGRVWMGGEPPHFEEAPVEGEPPFIPLFQELQEQSGLEFVEGPGTLSVDTGALTVTGTGTALAGPAGTDPDLNANREIRIAGRDYRIRRVVSPTELVLATPYLGPNAVDISYGLGPKLVGQPWEVRLPTQLILLQGAGAQLNPPEPG